MENSSRLFKRSYINVLFFSMHFILRDIYSVDKRLEKWWKPSFKNHF